MRLTLSEIAALVAIVCSIAGPIATLKLLGWRMKKIEDEIGDHSSGVRGRLHEHSNLLNEHEFRITMLEKGK